MIKKLIHQKKKGFSAMIASMFAILFMIMFLVLGLYMRAAEILSQNIKNDADSATMAAAVVNMEDYKSTYNFRIISTADPLTNDISDSERAEVEDRLYKYLSSLTTTMGITQTGFQGGNIGWAATQLGVTDFNIDDFYIYDYIDTTLIEYRVSNLDMMSICKITDSRDFGAVHISKRIGPSGSLSGSPFPDYKRSKSVLPTVYAVFSFNLELPRAFTPLGSGILTERISINSISQIERANP